MRENILKVFVITLLMGSAIGISLACLKPRYELNELKKELLDSGMARYNPTTGKFELIKPEGKK